MKKPSYPTLRITTPPALENAACAPATVPALTAKILDQLPGLIGATDNAIFAVTKERMPFVLVIFAEGQALHSTNMDPSVAARGIKALAEGWDG